MRIYRISNSFESWFSGSKVVDNEGNPIPVYHGTNQDFKKFDKKYLGENTFAKSALEGFFFTEDREEAKAYAELASNRQVKNKKEHELKIRNFERLNRLYERRGEWDKANDVIREWEDYEADNMLDKSGKKIYAIFLSIKNPMIIDATNLWNIGQVMNAIRLAKEKGHDGVKLQNINDGYIHPTNHWVAFKSSQIRIHDVEDFF